MTTFEKKQAESVFLDAGRNAFLIGVHPNDNPYKEDPFRQLWAKGYADAKYKYDGTFIIAGKAGFAAGLTLEDNPYRMGPKRALWARGWWKGKHAADNRAEAQKRYRSIPPPRRERKDRSRPVVQKKPNVRGDWGRFYGAATGRTSGAYPGKLSAALQSALRDRRAETMDR